MRLRVQRFFGLAGRVDELLPFVFGKLTAPRAFEGKRGECDVEIVASHIVVSARAEDFMALAIGGYKRGIECSSAQVVDKNARAPRIQRLRQPVCVFETRGRRLVDHRHDLDSSAPESFEGEQTLSGVRMRRNSDDCFQLALERLRRCSDGSRDVHEKPGDDLDERKFAVAELDFGNRADVGTRKQPFERAQVRCACEREARSLETVDRAGIGQRDNRRDVLPSIRIPIWKSEKRIVAAIRDSNVCARGSKVDSESHGARLLHLCALVGQSAPMREYLTGEARTKRGVL